MQIAPRISREELIEQAYFFRAVRQRLEEGWPTQQILEQLQGELLATTRMPLAVDFMTTQLKHGGRICDSMAGLPHYFTGFQTYVVAQSEAERAKFTFAQAMLILEREAEYKADTASPAGLFVYQLETLTRNQLGYLDGMMAMESDQTYDDDWRQYITFVRSQVGLMDFSELVYIRSRIRRVGKAKVRPRLRSDAATALRREGGPHRRSQSRPRPELSLRRPAATAWVSPGAAAAATKRSIA